MDDTIKVYREICGMYRISHPNKKLLARLSNVDNEGDISELDFSGEYLGNRGILSVAHLVKQRLYNVEVIKFRRMRMFATDIRPSAVCGNETIKCLCKLLSQHKKLKVLDLSENEIASVSYGHLVEFCKQSPSIHELILDDTLLEEHELLHLRTVIAIGPNLKGGSSSRSEQRGATSYSPSRWRQRCCFSDEQMRNMLEVQHTSGGMRKNGSKVVWELSDAPISNVVCAQPVVQGKVADFKSSTTVAAQVTAAKQTVRSNDPSVQKFPKVDRLKKRLSDILSNTSLFCSFKRGAFPVVSQVRNSRGEIASSSGRLDSTVEEMEVREIENAQRDQLAQLLGILVDYLYQRTYGDGDLILEVGDRAEWVYLVDGPPTAFVEYRRGDDTFHYKRGMTFGEEEVLADHGFSSTSVRHCSAVAHVPNEANSGPLVVWQLHRTAFRRILQDSLMKSRAQYKRFIDSLSSVFSLNPLPRSLLLDVVEEVIFPRPPEGTALDATPLLSGSFLKSHIIFIAEGRFSLRRCGKEVKDLGLGEILLLSQSSSTELELFASPTTAAASTCKICVVSLASLSNLPPQVMDHFAKYARDFEAIVSPQEEEKSPSRR